MGHPSFVWELGIGPGADYFLFQRAPSLESSITIPRAASSLRNFARSDSIRKELAALGILIEDSKDGARWKRK